MPQATPAYAPLRVSDMRVIETRPDANRQPRPARYLTQADMQDIRSMVELVRLYSNPLWSPSRWLIFIVALSHGRSCTEPAPRVPQRVERRLGTELIERIVAEYVAGVSTTRLAKGYGIGKGTLLWLISERGAVIRHQHRRN